MWINSHIDKCCNLLTFKKISELRNRPGAGADRIKWFWTSLVVSRPRWSYQNASLEVWKTHSHLSEAALTLPTSFWRAVPHPLAAKKPLVKPP